MKLLIFGAESSLGSHLLKYLSSRAHRSLSVVAAVTRRDRAWEKKFPNIQFVLCDLKLSHQITEALEGVSTVVNLYGRWDGKRYDLKVENCYSVRNIIHGMIRSHATHFLQVGCDPRKRSATGLFGSTKKLAEEFLKTPPMGIYVQVVRYPWSSRDFRAPSFFGSLFQWFSPRHRKQRTQLFRSVEAYALTRFGKTTKRAA